MMFKTSKKLKKKAQGNLTEKYNCSKTLSYLTFRQEAPTNCTTAVLQYLNKTLSWLMEVPKGMNEVVLRVTRFEIVTFLCGHFKSQNNTLPAYRYHLGLQINDECRKSKSELLRTFGNVLRKTSITIW